MYIGLAIGISFFSNNEYRISENDIGTPLLFYKYLLYQYNTISINIHTNISIAPPLYTTFVCVCCAYTITHV